MNQRSEVTLRVYIYEISGPLAISSAFGLSHLLLALP